jgi:hypothetical protein
MRQLKTLVFLLFSVLAMTACDNTDTPEPVVTITGINPNTATAGTDIKITGTEFGTDASAVVVTFTGGATGTVKAVTPTEITATVPAAAQTGTITVTVGSQAPVTSTAAFTVGARTVVEVQGNISTSTTWEAKNTYLIKGFVYVTNGAVLTIQPGTVIKGAPKEQDPAGQAKGGTLVVEPGGKLIAEGTADNPIVFTSSKPAGQRAYGDWGGVVLIGKAPHNQLASRQFEGGIRNQFEKFNEPADNSGTLKYVRIEFGGIALAANSEINGLTMYGVGSGTTIDYVQVSYGGDDAFEWFGGTVNAKHLVSFRNWDDDFDTDFGYTGKVQYGVVLRDPAYADQSGSNGFESDNQGNDGTNNGVVPTPMTEPVFANISVFGTGGTPSTATGSGSGGYQSAMHLRRSTSTSIFNSLFVGYPEGLRLDQTTTLANVTGGKLQLRGVVLANVTKPLVGQPTSGVTAVTDQQVTDFFNTAAFKNQSNATLATLQLNGATFNLTAPNFLPQTGSPLLTGAIWDGKGADNFFQKETFIGAFGTTNWAATWTNFNPQQTPYN